MIMKKQILILMAAMIALNGCSYFSWMNPWADEKKETAQSVTKVNKYLWQASLDRLSFTPLATQDAKAGVIVTDWFKMEGYPHDLFKIKVDILTKDLRSDGVKVEVIKKRMENGKWVSVDNSRRLQNSIENKILLKARDLYRKDLFMKK